MVILAVRRIFSRLMDLQEEIRGLIVALQVAVLWCGRVVVTEYLGCRHLIRDAVYNFIHF
jgi:hypothetical protein